MDQLTGYRQIIRQVLADYARYKPANGEIETELVVDAERDHFEVLHVGWDGVQRVHGPVSTSTSSAIKCGFSTTARTAPLPTN